MTTFRVTLEYDGTEFAGWQTQPADRRTIQRTLESAVARVTGARVRVVGSGRTDAGVHAEGQVASFRVATRLGAGALRRALNGVLPPDVAVVEAAEAPEGFDARRDARSKLYLYRVWSGDRPSPLRARASHWVPRRLDLPAMESAARAFLGPHDFASFRTAGSEVGSTRRTLSRFDVIGNSPGEVQLWLEGDGFLRHMVRNLVGTLLEVGAGRRAPDSMAAILAHRDRGRAGPTAPAAGLTLLRVCY